MQNQQDPQNQPTASGGGLTPDAKTVAWIALAIVLIVIGFALIS